MPANQPLPLSNPQHRIWITELLHNTNEMSNIGYLIHLHENCHLPTLAQAIQYVVKNNKGLQLRFHPNPHNPSELLQHIPPYTDIPIETIHAQSHQELLEKIETLHRQPFPPNNNWMCSFAVFSINNQTSGFFEKASHLAADGISAIIVARETIETYRHMRAGTFRESPKPYDYRDFLQAEQEYLTGPKYATDQEYWRQRFDNFTGEEIIFAPPPHTGNSLRVRRLSLGVPPHAIPLIERFKTERRAANFHLFMAALTVYIQRRLHADDMVIGMPAHNRSQKIFRDMAGMFVSTLPFRVGANESRSFREWIDDIKKRLWEDLKHQSYPYNRLVRDLKEQDIDTTGFLNVQLIELPEINLPEIASRQFYSTTRNISQLSIYLNQQNSKDLSSLDAAIDYHEDLFSEEEIRALFHRLITILEQGAADPDTPLENLPLLTPEELDMTLRQLNPPPVPWPDGSTLTELIAAQTERTPDAPALDYNGTLISYGRLDSLSNTLAALLYEKGVKQGAAAGLLCERSPEAVVAILAILKTGAAYLPVDPDYPPERIQYIIENSQIRVLAADDALQGRIGELERNNPNLAAVYVRLPELEAKPLAWRGPAINPEDPAYIIYTSGTTGNPKGAVIRHRNAVNYIWWAAKSYSGDERADYPLFTSLSFDLTVTSTFIPLIRGDKIIIYRENTDGLLIERVLRENKSDVVKLTPSHLKIIAQTPGLSSDRVKGFIVGGEELKTETALEIRRRFNGDIRIYNEYGPTETTVGCMIHRFDPETDTGAAVPIGVPADNTRIYILDRRRRPLPVGMPGEIYIAGEGVALGYLHNPTLTAEKFPDDPFVPGEKMYKSGDLGRWNFRHILEYLGRCDEQVKIRGYRIELGEIEHRLMKIPGVRDAAATVRKAPHPELVAYLTAEEGRALNAQLLRETLARELPSYMIPAELYEVEAIPLTRNGKRDMRKLEAMGRRLEFSRGYYEPLAGDEALTAEVWAEVLRLPRVSRFDNFFELGGDSIKAVQIAARLNERGKAVNVRDILAHETIAALCARVDMNRRERRYQQGPMTGEKGFSPIEKWFIAGCFADPQHYCQSVLLEFHRPIDRERLIRAASALLHLHDGLRLNLKPDGSGFIYNASLLDAALPLPVTDLTAIRGEEHGNIIAQTGAELKQNFDIFGGPLIRLHHFMNGRGKDRLLMSLHHLASDGVTLRLLLEDLARNYSALLENGPLPSFPKTASLNDWLDGLLLWRDSGLPEQEEAFWRRMENPGFRLPGAPSVAPLMRDQRSIAVVLPEPDTAYLLRDAHEAYKTDVQILALAALVAALRDWTGSEVLTVEMEGHGRSLENIDLSRTVGWFTAMYPITLHLRDRTPDMLIKTVKEALRQTPRGGLGYGVLGGLSVSGVPSVVPAAECRFNYLGRFDAEISNSFFQYAAMSTGPESSPRNPLTAALEVNAMITFGVFSAEFGYDGCRFAEVEMRQLAHGFISHFQVLLDHIRRQEAPQFTPSDFDAANLNEADLSALFGD